MTPDSEGVTQSESILTPGDDDYVTIDLAVGGGSGTGSTGSRRVVSEVEWNLLNEEIRRARSRIGRSCQLCSNYQTQLQKVGSLLHWSQFYRYMYFFCIDDWLHS